MWRQPPSAVGPGETPRVRGAPPAPPPPDPPRRGSPPKPIHPPPPPTPSLPPPASAPRLGLSASASSITGAGPEIPPSFLTRQKCTIIRTEATIGIPMQCQI